MHTRAYAFIIAALNHYFHHKEADLTAMWDSVIGTAVDNQLDLDRVVDIMITLLLETVED